MADWPPSVGREIHETLDSTNAEAARRAAGGEAGPVWILARRQSAARGRRGRSWASAEGALLATCLFRPEAGPREAALYSFAACLAVADLFDRLAPAAEVALKWPNDALLNGRKAAGVLLECSGGGGKVDWLALGVGVNLVAAPAAEAVRPGGAAPTSVLAEGGRAVGPEEALDLLAAAFAFWGGLLEREGFAPVRAAWLARAARLGEVIGAGLANERLEGVFEDVDQHGELVLRTTTGRRTVTAADVYFPDAAIP